MRYDSDGLTVREKEIYEYIIRYKTINGMSPTISEIAEALYTSRSFVRTVLYNLTDKGYINYDNSKRRSIVVCKFL